MREVRKRGCRYEAYLGVGRDGGDWGWMREKGKDDIGHVRRGPGGARAELGRNGEGGRVWERRHGLAPL